MTTGINIASARYPVAILRVLLFIAGWMLIASVTYAMPPHPDLQDGIARGEIVPPRQTDIPLDVPVAMKLNAPSARQAPELSGPYRALCILVDFSDHVSQVTSTKFDTLIFADRTGSVRDYYQEVSYSQLDLITVNLPSSIGWQRAPQPYSYYVDDNFGTDSPYPNNTQKLCEDLVDQVDSVVDFSQYDNDDDGYVDVVMIVHAGRGAEFTGSSSDIWSHKWSISPRNRDGVFVSDYTVMPEYWISAGDMTAGVFCHELGHVFGLPDLYDTDASSYGTGYWSLMSNGSWNGSLGNSPAHPDAWSRVRLGWVTPINIVNNTADVSIPNVESSASVFRLWSSGSAGDEYFLVENRQRIGYDAALPSAGLLIWHIDDTVNTNQHEWYPGHTGSGHYRVALEQADNQYHLEQRTSAGDTGDPFPGASNNTSFSPVSEPNSDGYAASSSYVAVTNISGSASTMNADFAVSFASGNDDDIPVSLPRLELEQNYPNPFNPVTTIEFTVPKSGEVTVRVYNLLGEMVALVASGWRQAGTHTATWDGRDSDGAPAASGIYLYELTTEDEREVRKMALVR